MPPDLPNRDFPCYSVADAATMVGVPAQTLRRWIRPDEPLFPPAAPGESFCLSFANVVEAHAVATLRRKFRLPLPRLRTGVAFCREHGIDRPFLQDDLRAVSMNVYLDRDGDLVNLGSYGQLGIRPVLEDHLERVKFHDRSPLLFYPLTRPEKSPHYVAVDPERSFGRPMTSEGFISTAVIYARFSVGESVESLVSDYDITAPYVEEAIRYESVRSWTVRRDTAAA